MEILEKNKNTIENSFDNCAHSYGTEGEYSPISHIFVSRLKIISNQLPDPYGLNILSIGCGPAPMASHIINNKGTYFGIDLSHEMLNEALRRNKGESLNLVHGNILNLPFRDKFFDILLCLGVLEYVNDINISINELSRIIKDNGYLYISMQNKYNPYRIWEYFIYYGFLFNTIRYIKGHNVSTKPLEKIYSLRELIEVFRKNYFHRSNHIFYNYNFWLKPLDKRFPNQCVVTTRKFESIFNGRCGLLAADFILVAQKIG